MSVHTESRIHRVQACMLLCSTFTAVMLLFTVYRERPSCVDDRLVVGMMHTPHDHLLNAVGEFYTYESTNRRIIY